MSDQQETAPGAGVQVGRGPVSTVLKVLLREHHLQSYPLFRREYEKVARKLNPELVGTAPAEPTFRRWLAGNLKDIPYPHHCAVLEAMLPGWKAVELFRPYTPPEAGGRTPVLAELLRDRHVHNYRAFCQAYELAAAVVDRALVGTCPTEREYFRWLDGEVVGLPHRDHCAVLEAMFPGYTARRLFELINPTPAPGDPDNPEEPRDPEVLGDPEEPRDAATSSPVAAPVAPVSPVAAPPVQVRVGGAAVVVVAGGQVLGTRSEGVRAYHRRCRVLRRWAEAVKRRTALGVLGWGVAAASVGYQISPDEQRRVTAALTTPDRVDAATIGHLDAVLRGCKQLNDGLGPRGVLDIVLAQRDLTESLVAGCPDALRPTLLSTLSRASGLAGWLSFDLNDFDSAACYFEDARSWAHQAEDTEAGAVLLRDMSRLAIWQGNLRVGIDHALAAEHWASQTEDMRLRAFCAAGVGRVYAANGQRDACLAALDRAETSLGKIGDQPCCDFAVRFDGIRYDEGMHTSYCGECYLDLGDAERAAASASQSLAALGASPARVVVLTMVDLGRARVLAREIEEASRLFGDAAEIAARHSSLRLLTAVRQGRAELQPWQDAAAVHELDDRLGSYGLA